MGNDKQQVKYEDILNASGGFSILNSFAFPSQVMLKLARMERWVEGHKEDYDGVRKKLLEAHGTKKEDGSWLWETETTFVDGKELTREIRGTVKMKDQREWEADLEALRTARVNTNGLKVTEEDVSKVRDGFMVPTALRLLGPLFDWGAEDPAVRDRPSSAENVLAEIEARRKARKD